MNSKKIKNQGLREKECKDGYGYWDWVKQRPVARNTSNSLEDNQANPDQLNNAQAYYYQSDASKETTEKVHKLMEWAPHFLTEKQWRVFDSIAIQMNSVKETAFTLGLTRSTVDKHFKAAQKRLQKLYESI